MNTNFRFFQNKKRKGVNFLNQLIFEVYDEVDDKQKVMEKIFFELEKKSTKKFLSEINKVEKKFCEEFSLGNIFIKKIYEYSKFMNKNDIENNIIKKIDQSYVNGQNGIFLAIVKNKNFVNFFFEFVQCNFYYTSFLEENLETFERLFAFFLTMEKTNSFIIESVLKKFISEYSNNEDQYFDIDERNYECLNKKVIIKNILNFSLEYGKINKCHEEILNKIIMEFSLK